MVLHHKIVIVQRISCVENQYTKTNQTKQKSNHLIKIIYP
jgi:hypothetical protein